MIMATKKTTKAEQAKAVVEKLKQTALCLAPEPTPSELVMVPLALIETRPQVRREFDEAGLAELAADIAARGVLQPVLLRPNPGKLDYLLIAGERRVRAARLAKVGAIPAIIGDVDDETAEAMQLAENIQREDLTLADEARMIRKLYDLAGSVTAVAERLHKSKAWVSKRLAASCPDLRQFAREVLEGGYSEDLEIILTLDKLQVLDWCACRDLCEMIKKGKAGRQTVREAYETAKARAEEIEARRAEEEAAAADPERQAKIEAEKERWRVENEKAMEAHRLDPERIAWNWDGDLPGDELLVLLDHLEKHHQAGAKETEIGMLSRLAEMIHNNSASTIEVMAFVAGKMGMRFDGLQLMAIGKNALFEGEED